MMCLVSTPANAEPPTANQPAIAVATTNSANSTKEIAIDLGGGVKMEFVWIEALKMWVGKYPVTNQEYRKYKADHDSGKYEERSLNEDRQPVVQVSYNDAVTFAEWMNRTAKFPDGYKCRLPDGKEWLTYAQCGDGRKYPWGNEWPPKYGNYADATAKKSFPVWAVIEGYDNGYDVACPVEKSGKNDWRLYGVGGNVWQWTSEPSPSGKSRCLRGGSWVSVSHEGLECAYFNYNNPSDLSLSLGFRLLLSSGVTSSVSAPVNTEPPAANSPVSPTTVVAKLARTAIATTTNSSKSFKEMSIDLGGGLKLEFVWIEALKMWIGKYPVTNQEYRRFKPEHDSGTVDRMIDGHTIKYQLNDNHQPVVKVDHTDAVEFADWVDRTADLPEGYECRLPHEEEWLTFAQCGDGRSYPWGNEWPPPNNWNYNGEEGAFGNGKICGHNDGYPVTCPVEKSGKNDWGLYGVGDNVEQWTCDDYYGRPNGMCAVMRGSSWYSGDDTNYLKCAFRAGSYSPHCSNTTGFRLVLAR